MDATTRRTDYDPAYLAREARRIFKAFSPVCDTYGCAGRRKFTGWAVRVTLADGHEATSLIAFNTCSESPDHAQYTTERL
jgi:hypothetical protein